MGELRETKKRATRQRISDVATAMFFARGFDAVTVDEIAAAAQVSKVTVFNYFARKEDLHIDREEDIRQLLRDTLATRGQGESPLDALRGLVERLVAENSPYACASQHTVDWWRVVAASPALRARARELGDRMVEVLASELDGGGEKEPGGLARLVAGTVVLTWRTAYAEALQVLAGAGAARTKEKRARATFLALVDRGFAAARLLASGRG